jgi:hypothetical protein
VRVDVSPRRKNAPRPAQKSAPGFLQWLRGRVCLFHYCHDCEGKIEASHIDFAGDKGMGTKVSDRYAIPMCAHHHRQQHAMGWQSFMDARKTKAIAVLRASEQYWRAWPGRIAWERKLEERNG